MARKSKSFIVDDSVFQQRARRLAKLLKVDERQFVREQGGLLARAVAIYTPPYATFPDSKKKTIGTKKDFDEGRNAAKRDVDLITTEVENVTWAKKQFGSGKIYRGRKQVGAGVIDNLAQLKRWHNKNRRANGKTRKVDHSDRFWVKKTLLDDYKKQLIAYVGISKAGPAKAALQLGAKGSIPKPVKIQLGRVKASGRMAQTSKGPYAIIRASASRSPGLAHVQHLMPMIMRDRLIKAVKRLRYLKRQTVKRAGFKN